MEHIIEIKHLCKSFRDIKAVDDLSFHVKKGELFAFLGVNGAGKSTTISMMCNQLPPDSGEIFIGGESTKGKNAFVSSLLGVVFQNSVLDKPLTVMDNLISRGALYGLKGETLQNRIRELSVMLDFEPLLSRTVGKLSGGQRRRIDIARALLHHPQILVLDEPTTGLDPQTRRLLWDTITSLRKQENMTVFLTTHYMEEAAEADYVIVLDSGRVAAEGTPLSLKNTYTGDFITLYHPKEEDLNTLALPYERVKEGARIVVKNTAAATELICKHPEIFVDYEISKGKMDDVFLAVTGKALNTSFFQE
ncbi:MAG: ABC transporter ATP-binding protein [Clostridia bacterium]|nr:ABC transporter ATP-binding protein [Clostridia bacterium]